MGQQWKRRFGALAAGLLPLVMLGATLLPTPVAGADGNAPPATQQAQTNFWLATPE